MSFGDLEKGQGRGYQSGYQAGPPPISISGRGDDEYAQLNSKVTSAIQQLSSNVTSLQKLTSQLGTSKDTEEMREKLHQVNEKSRDLVQATTKDLQHLARLETGVDSQQRKMQQTKLSKDFQEALKRYSDIQKISAQKQREFVSQAKKKTESMKYEVAHQADSSDDTHGMLVEDQKRQQVQAMENEIEFNEAMIAEREEGIKDIESSIAQVNEIFKDLSLMVKEQGQTLDTIESNISNVVSHTDGANVELKGANKYQKKSRNKMCCLLAIAVIVLTGLVLVIVLNVI